MSTTYEKGFSLLFKRPFEGLFTARENTVYDLPENFLTDRYKPIGANLQSRFGENIEQRIPLTAINEPDLSFTKPIRKNGPFSLFNGRDKKIAAQLIKLFMDETDTGKCLSIAAYTRDRVNPYLFQYALTVAMQHREDTKNIPIPSIANVFPDQFIDPTVFREARAEQALDVGTRMTVDIPLNFTANEREDEQKLAYFREDIGLNLHHWHWHLVYPAEGDARIVKKDRRGELFYYMHNQTINRYNVERICNGLEIVKPLNDLRAPMPEAYFPKIIRSSNNRAYPPRVNNAIPQDVNRPEDGVSVQVADLIRWRDRFFEIIDRGYCIDTKGNHIELDEINGIDILGDIMEASVLSPNPQLYGNLHAEGHNILAYAHDPEGRYLEDFGVIGDNTTAMRDPIFYRWHSFVENCFIKYKETLIPYIRQQLDYGGIFLNSINVQITRGNKAAPNVLLTYWQRADIDLGAGLDFGNSGNVFAQFTHLQHAPFEMRISVTNNRGTIRRGTCRIFMCPQTDQNGVELTFQKKRLLLIEIDKFNVNLNPGENVIRRRDDESNVTIPYERSFRNIGSQAQNTASGSRDVFQFCGCGWPNHLLIPKGSLNGTKFDIFVMISNYDDDRVVQTDTRVGECDDAASYCGLRNKLYPDKRAMGYPFDRIPDAKRIQTLEDFVSQTTNMGLGECTIRFVNTYIDRN